MVHLARDREALVLQPVTEVVDLMRMRHTMPATKCPCELPQRVHSMVSILYAVSDQLLCTHPQVPLACDGELNQMRPLFPH